MNVPRDPWGTKATQYDHPETGESHIRYEITKDTEVLVLDDAVNPNAKEDALRILWCLSALVGVESPYGFMRAVMQLVNKREYTYGELFAINPVRKHLGLDEIEWLELKR